MAASGAHGVEEAGGAGRDIAPAVFTPVDLENWPRREYFAYYFDRLKCRYSITATLDITRLMRRRRQVQRRFFVWRKPPARRGVLKSLQLCPCQ